MKILDKFINFIFSLAMIIASTAILLVLLNLADVRFIDNLVNNYLWNPEYRTTAIIVVLLVWLAAIKTTIFLADFKQKKKESIIVNSENGSIRIAGETVESTAKAVAKMYNEVKDVNVKMVNKKKGIDLYMSISVSQDTNIKDLTQKIQDAVKAKIQNTTGVVVLNTDIKVKNVIGKSKDAVVPVAPIAEVPSNNEQTVMPEETVETTAQAPVQETLEQDAEEVKE